MIDARTELRLGFFCHHLLPMIRPELINSLVKGIENTNALIVAPAFGANPVKDPRSGAMLLPAL